MATRIPSLRLHKPSQQAVVTIAGRDHYCGPWGSRRAQTEHQRLVGEWLASGGAPRVTARERGASRCRMRRRPPLSMMRPPQSPASRSNRCETGRHQAGGMPAFHLHWLRSAGFPSRLRCFGRVRREADGRPVLPRDWPFRGPRCRQPFFSASRLSPPPYRLRRCSDCRGTPGFFPSRGRDLRPKNACPAAAFGIPHIPLRSVRRQRRSLALLQQAGPGPSASLLYLSNSTCRYTIHRFQAFAGLCFSRHAKPDCARRTDSATHRSCSHNFETCRALDRPHESAALCRRHTCTTTSRCRIYLSHRGAERASSQTSFRTIACRLQQVCSGPLVASSAADNCGNCRRRGRSETFGAGHRRMLDKQEHSPVALLAYRRGVAALSACRSCQSAIAE